MFELLYEIEAVSTGKIFAETGKQGVPIHVLDDPETLEADLALISAYTVTKNHIRSYVNAGYVAMIPQRAVSVGDWTGNGWIVTDEETGATGYMICGGLHGDNTMLSGGSLSKALENLMVQLGLFLAKVLKTIDSFVVLDTILLAGVVHIIAAMLVILEYQTLLVFLFSMGGMALGAIFIAVALRVFTQLLKNIYGMYFLRRKVYA